MNRVFVIGGPVGLLLALLVGLWAAQLHVRRSVIVQVDETWVAGEQLAIRAQLVDQELRGVEGATVDLSVVTPAGDPLQLGVLEAGPKSGIAQGTVIAPNLPPGAATLVLRFGAPAMASFEEEVPITFAAEHASRRPQDTISTHTLQWADDTDAQPEGVRIVLRPAGRLQAGFTNRLLVRVTEPNGTPWSGPIEVVLLDGEFMGMRAAAHAPATLVRGSTNEVGLLGLEGPLTSEMLRIEVRVLDRDVPETVRWRRMFRLVSYAGAVQVDVDPIVVEGRAPVEIHARGLGSKRPVFVDVYGPTGAWIDTLSPPVFGSEPPRPWLHSGLQPGVVQIEAYHFTNAPGESAAIARLHIVDRNPADGRSLIALVDMQRERLEIPRIEKDFDPVHERAYLDHLVTDALPGQALELGRVWLLGTLPVAVYGPPVALTTRGREEAAVAALKEAWRIGLRWILLGGGGLFLLAMTWAMVKSHERAAKATLVELHGETDDDGRAALEAHVRRARRSALLRGVGVLGIMAAGLGLTVLLLENLL